MHAVGLTLTPFPLVCRLASFALFRGRGEVLVVFVMRSPSSCCALRKPKEPLRLTFAHIYECSRLRQAFEHRRPFIIAGCVAAGAVPCVHGCCISGAASWRLRSCHCFRVTTARAVRDFKGQLGRWACKSRSRFHSPWRRLPSKKKKGGWGESQKCASGYCSEDL